MIRVPEDCRFRKEMAIGDDVSVTCSLLGRITGISDPCACIVAHDACVACCNSLGVPEQINPVVASLVYTLTSRIVADGGHPECSVAQATAVMSRVTDQLSVIVKELPEQHFPPTLTGTDRRVDPAAHTSQTTFRWAAAMLTAPRRNPRIEQTLDSLHKAGFDDIQIFAEPRAWIPDRYRGLKITQRSQRFGNFLNFYSCLSTLFSEQPDADAYVVFQDDIEVATELRAWCENQLWPLDNGVVSLFTPRLHSERTAGWHIKSPGFQRVCGAQALVFRGDLLQRFLSDARVLNCLRLRNQGDDAVLGGWLAREGLGIAYHTPSMVQHVGGTSSIYAGSHDLRNLANAVQSVTGINDWRPPPPVPGKIGLVGWNSATGLGSINRDLIRRLEIKRWLAPIHPWLASNVDASLNAVKITTDLRTTEEMARWVSGFDWLLFVERPYIESLPRIAAHAGVGIACVPMWEWVQPNDDWLQFVDLMICPTLHTFRLMDDWTRRYGFGWKTVYVPWPIDAERFPFQQREVCREFLFVNGWGGGKVHYPDLSLVPYQRKGLELIIAAAKLAPDLNFVIRSLHRIPSQLPKNVRVVPALRDNVGLFDEGDVCVQPSHYEGLGLQLLECQAAGMPLVTTAGPPMNETNPWRTIPTCGQEVVLVGSGYISAEIMSPEALVDTLRPLVGTDIREASRQARSYIETERNWDTARQLIQAELIRR